MISEYIRVSFHLATRMYHFIYSTHALMPERTRLFTKWLRNPFSVDYTLESNIWSHLHCIIYKKTPVMSQTIFSNTFSWIKNCILILISLKFVPVGQFDNKAALVHAIAWSRSGDKPLPEPMLILFTDAYMLDYGRWVKSLMTYFFKWYPSFFFCPSVLSVDASAIQLKYMRRDYTRQTLRSSLKVSTNGV